MCFEQIVAFISNIGLVIVTGGLWRTTTRYTKATERLEKITKMNVVDNIFRVCIMVDQGAG